MSVPWQLDFEQKDRLSLSCLELEGILTKRSQDIFTLIHYHYITNQFLRRLLPWYFRYLQNTYDLVWLAFFNCFSETYHQRNKISEIWLADEGEIFRIFEGGIFFTHFDWFSENFKNINLNWPIKLKNFLWIKEC